MSSWTRSSTAVLENYKFSYRRKGKHIFVPNDECRRRGKELIDHCADLQLPSYVYHYRPGGHVAALHAHRANSYFFRIDLKDFYYAIARNRVARVLHAIRYKGARACAEWSCVKSPYLQPSYALPIGFIQSPLIATLVTLRSPIARAIETAAADGVFISIYFDDFVGSAADKAALTRAYDSILTACQQANFAISDTKLIPPSDKITAFNCALANGVSEVSTERVAKFYSAAPGASSAEAFEDYCDRVRN